MNSRDVSKFANRAAHRHARKSRAFRRGVVQGRNADGTINVLLPGNGVVKCYQNNLYEPGVNEPVTVHLGAGYELIGPSPYGGGNGGAFDPGP